MQTAGGSTGGEKVKRDAKERPGDKMEQQSLSTASITKAKWVLLHPTHLGTLEVASLNF